MTKEIFFIGIGILLVSLVFSKTPFHFLAIFFGLSLIITGLIESIKKSD